MNANLYPNFSALDDVKADPSATITNGDVANYYRRKSSSYHPSMAVRRASVVSTGSSHHPHVPEMNEMVGSQGGLYNYGYDEMIHSQEFLSGQPYQYYQEYSQ